MTYNPEAVKRWREKNKERYAEWKKQYNKKWSEENPDKAKAIRKRARIKHREKQKQKDTLIEQLIEERNYREEKYRALDLEVMKRFGIHL